MKRLFDTLLCAVLLLGLAFTVHASNYNLIEDFNRSCGGDGWHYDAETKTLTLSGYDRPMPADDYDEVVFDSIPEGFTIHLTDGTENTLPYFICYGAAEDIVCRITGNGTLILSSDFMGGFIQESGTVICQNRIYGSSVTVNGGTLQAAGSKAIGQLTVNGGEVRIDDLDVYNLNITGGKLTMKALHNGNGSALRESSYTVSGGSLHIEGGGRGTILVFYNDLAPGEDITAELLKKLKSLGTLTDGGNAPVFPAVENSGNEIYTVTFVGEDGAAAEEIHVLTPHSHSYTVMDPVNRYLYSPAACTQAAVYYYCCDCGKTGTQTYTCGDPLAHTYRSGICADCSAQEPTEPAVTEGTQDTSPTEAAEVTIPTESAEVTAPTEAAEVILPTQTTEAADPAETAQAIGETEATQPAAEGIGTEPTASPLPDPSGSETATCPTDGIRSTAPTKTNISTDSTSPSNAHTEAPDDRITGIIIWVATAIALLSGGAAVVLAFIKKRGD